MDFLTILRTYFRAEANSAWFFIVPGGILLIAIAWALLAHNRTAFDWGLAVPCLLLGLALAGVGAGVGARTPGQVQTLVDKYQASPSAMVKDELPRMQKVMKNFRTTFVVFGVLAVVGLAVMYGVRKEWSTGLGVALVFAGGLGLLVDTVAERRALPYVAALEKIAAESNR